MITPPPPSSGSRPHSWATEESHLLEMMVKSEHLAEPEVVHGHLGRAIRKRPLLILIEPFKHRPGRLFQLFTDMDNDENAACPHQVNSAFERYRTSVTDIRKQ